MWDGFKMRHYHLSHLFILLVASWAIAPLFWLFCSGRKGRCDTGRTRKQEPSWDQKNRKQEEAPIRWLLWFILRFLLVWIIVHSPLNHSELDEIRANDGFIWKFAVATQRQVSELLSFYAIAHLFIYILFDFGTFNLFLHFLMFPGP